MVFDMLTFFLICYRQGIHRSRCQQRVISGSIEIHDIADDLPAGHLEGGCRNSARDAAPYLLNTVGNKIDMLQLATYNSNASIVGRELLSIKQVGA